MSAFFAALMAVLGPMLAQLLQSLLKALIDKWTKKPETAAILDACNTPEELHAAVPRLRALVDNDFKGIRRVRMQHVLNRLERKPVTDAIWDQMVTSGAKSGPLTNVPHAAVMAAIKED